jgi:hypothetical protein
MANARNNSLGIRSVWANSQSLELPDLVRTIFALTLLAPDASRASYFCSPWMSDFPVFDNAFDEFSALFPDLAAQRQIWFSEFLIQLASVTTVRVVTTRSDTSRTFLANSKLSQQHGIEVRLADDMLHEKGILLPRFYLEGSMNITFMGIRIRQEKLVLHADRSASGTAAISNAYLEFNRRWDGLSEHT